jgi:hypothetical protein
MNPLDQLYAKWNGKFPDLYKSLIAFLLVTLGTVTPYVVTAFGSTTLNTLIKLNSPTLMQFSMIASVIGSIGYLKVLYMVISLITVLVMYNLGRLEFTSQVLLHNQSMFFLVALGSIYSSVALLLSPTALPSRVFGYIVSDVGLMTLLRTIGGVMSLMALVVLKPFTAFSTIKPTLSRLVVALSTTKQSLTARRVLESFTAKVTYILHGIEYSTKSEEVQLCIH